jgi:hypothetical protein
MKKPIVLFILKRRDDFDPERHNAKGLSTGLFNSATFMQEMLNDAGIDARLEVAIDNNCIDRLVTKHRPTHVIIEALWVVPPKFTILSKLHPSVTWIIRVHSEMPFLAGEGMALDWIADYLQHPKIKIGINAPRMLNEIHTYIRIKENWADEKLNDKIFYMPNFYPQQYKTKNYEINKEHIDIGCFGAVRPLKNHVLQAIAALKFADSIGKKLHFHINGGRIEMKGEPVMNNLRALFQHLIERGHKLVIHEWTPRENFLEICASMDIGLQVSFSETFNIVGADIISQGVPLVGSTEIPWLDEKYSARAVFCDEIYNSLMSTHLSAQDNVSINQANLTNYTNLTRDVWVEYFKKEEQNG